MTSDKEQGTVDAPLTTHDARPTTVVVNGDSRTLLRSSNAAEMLAELGLDPRAVVVELNRTIIRRAALAETPIAEGDVVEIVHFVGGG